MQVITLQDNYLAYLANPDIPFLARLAPSSPAHRFLKVRAMLAIPASLDPAQPSTQKWLNHCCINEWVDKGTSAKHITEDLEKFISPNQNWESESERLESRIRKTVMDLLLSPQKGANVRHLPSGPFPPASPSRSPSRGADTIHRDKGGLGVPRGHFTLEHLRLQAGERVGQRGGLKETREKTRQFLS